MSTIFIFSSHGCFCRFRRGKGHTPDDLQPRLQNLHHVRDCQHRSYGHLCIVRRGPLAVMCGEVDLFCATCIALFLRPRAAVWRRWISSLDQSPQNNVVPILRSLSEVSGPAWCSVIFLLRCTYAPAQRNMENLTSPRIR